MESQEYLVEATSGDDDHLLQTTMALGRLAVATTSIRHGQLTAPALRLGWCVQPADDGRTGVVEALRAVVKGELRGDGWVTGVASPAHV